MFSNAFIIWSTKCNNSNFVIFSLFPEGHHCEAHFTPVEGQRVANHMQHMIEDLRTTNLDCVNIYMHQIRLPLPKVASKTLVARDQHLSPPLSGMTVTLENVRIISGILRRWSCFDCTKWCKWRAYVTLMAGASRYSNKVASYCKGFIPSPKSFKD